MRTFLRDLCCESIFAVTPRSSPWIDASMIHYMYYNFGRIHKSLRVTPAMEAGVSDHVWSLEEIAKLAD